MFCSFKFTNSVHFFLLLFVGFFFTLPFANFFSERATRTHKDREIEREKRDKTRLGASNKQMSNTEATTVKTPRRETLNKHLDAISSKDKGGGGDHDVLRLIPLPVQMKFLLEEYKKFLNMDTETRAMHTEFNKSVHESLDCREFKLGGLTDESVLTHTLRELHLNYAFTCAILSSVNVTPENAEDVKSLMRTKIALQLFMSFRKSRGEIVVPAHDVWTTAQTCRNNPKLLMSAVLQWVPEEKKRMFMEKLNEHTIRSKLDGSVQKLSTRWILEVTQKWLQSDDVTHVDEAYHSFGNMAKVYECIELAQMKP